MHAAVEKNFELSAEAAGSFLKRMLVGSYLDCFIVSSIPVSLKFINDSLYPENSLYVNLDLSCDAMVDNGGCNKVPDSSEGFFVRRAKFLADLYSCIGREVADIHLDVDGSLSIYIDGSVITVQLAQEDKIQEDSVWKVEMELPADHHVSTMNAVMCVPKGDGVSFLSGSRSP